MADDFDPALLAPALRFEPLQSRILVCPAPVGSSPWCAGFGPVRPLWSLNLWAYHQPRLRPILHAMRCGEIAMDRGPIIDARVLSLSLTGAKTMCWFYPWLRGLYMRTVPYGVRLAAMVRWGPPNLDLRDWTVRWTSRVVGPIWVWPELQAHGRWLVPLDDWVYSYERWFAPLLSYDSGLVLDTRMLALMGVPIPLPAAMADLVRPHVRLLSLADIPGPAHRQALGWTRNARPWLEPSGAWLPGTAGRYSLARWAAFLAQFPHVPVYVPALRHPVEMPPWLDLRAEPSRQPAGSVAVPPPMSAVATRHATSKTRGVHRAARTSRLKRRHYG